MPERIHSHAPRGIRPRYTGSVLLLACACVLLATGCTSRADRDLQSVPEVLYERAQRSMDSNNYANAIRFYEALEARYPFSSQARQAQLDLIYAYYRNGQRESAIDAATQFERENPTHPRVDYAIYMRGVANFRGQHSWFHRWLNIDLAQRPPRQADEALSAFMQLLTRYPDSPYAEDARQRMIFLRNWLARHENYVAAHYMERGAYLAALNRARYAMDNYEGAPAVIDSLRIMIDAYERLGMQDLAGDTRRVLAASFPDARGASSDDDRPWYRFW